MTDTMDVVTRKKRASSSASAEQMATEDLAAKLMARADAEGVNPGGLLQGLTKAVLEAAWRPR